MTTVRLYNANRSQTTSKCGENKKVAYKAQLSVSLMFLPHFDLLPITEQMHDNMECIASL